MGDKVLGEGKYAIVVLLALSLLASLCPWTVNLTCASQHSLPLRWDRMVRVGWIWVCPFLYVEG